MAIRHSRFVRRYAEFTDQHGRRWGATVEGETGHPTGPVDLMHRTPAGNLPPWIPEAKYLVFDPLNQGRLTIDYETAVNDRLQSVDDWEARLKEMAFKMHPNDAGEQIEKPGVALLSVIGLRPAAPDLVEACQAGNKWALGFSDAMPDWAAPLARVTGPIQTKPRPKDYPDAAEKPTKQKAG